MSALQPLLTTYRHATLTEREKGTYFSRRLQSLLKDENNQLKVDDARILQGQVADYERPDQDIQWNRITELEMEPHPANVQHPDAIEAEYGMDGGVLKIRARAAMAGYLLRRWNVDCTEDHSIKGGEYRLWLRNRQAHSVSTIWCLLLAMVN